MVTTLETPWNTWKLWASRQVQSRRWLRQPRFAWDVDHAAASFQVDIARNCGPLWTIVDTLKYTIRWSEICGITKAILLEHGCSDNFFFRNWLGDHHVWPINDKPCGYYTPLVQETGELFGTTAAWSGSPVRKRRSCNGLCVPLWKKPKGAHDGVHRLVFASETQRKFNQKSPVFRWVQIHHSSHQYLFQISHTYISHKKWTKCR